MKISKDKVIIISIEEKDGRLEVITSDDKVSYYPVDAFSMLLEKMKRCEGL